MLKSKSVLVLSIFCVLGTFSCATQTNNVTVENKGVSSFSGTQISGRVEFPNFNIKATINEIAPKATVSLLYPSDYSDTNLKNVSVASGLTSANGQFNINTSAGFVPQSGQVYVLEAVKRLGGAGNNVLTLRTHLKWNGTSLYFESITAGSIFINTTTALSIISSLGGVPADDTIRAMDIVNGIIEVSDINYTITALKIDEVKELVEDSLDDIDIVNFGISVIDKSCKPLEINKLIPRNIFI